MKTKTLYTLILLLSILSLFTSAQSFTEKVRADFLTNYYSNYQNESGLDSSMISESDSIEDTISLNRSQEIKTHNKSAIKSEDLEIIKANFLNSLNNENIGVVESAIYVTIQFKNKFPDENSAKLVEALDRIINENNSPRILYKAQLAKIYITNSNWFENVKINSIHEENEVYAAIAETVNGKLFSDGL